MRVYPVPPLSYIPKNHLEVTRVNIWSIFLTSPENLSSTTAGRTGCHLEVRWLASSEGTEGNPGHPRIASELLSGTA